MTPEFPSDPELQTIELSCGRATYTDEGDGPILVAIHGLPGSTKDFRWLAPALSPHIRLIRLNLPGFEGTDIRCIKDTSIQARGQFVQEFLMARNIQECVVMGHSMGGPVATEVAVRFPECIRGLVLLASVGLRPHRAYRKGPSFVWVSRLLRIPGMSWLMKQRIQEAYGRLGFPQSIPYPAMLQSLHYVGGLRFEHIHHNQQRLRVPTLLSWAEDDIFIEPEISQELADACPPGPRLIFPEGGHNIQKTQAIELAQTLSSWIQRL